MAPSSIFYPIWKINLKSNKLWQPKAGNNWGDTTVSLHELKGSHFIFIA